MGVGGSNNLDLLIYKAIAAVAICSVCRFILNLQDRVIFSKIDRGIDFQTNILFCGLFPFGYCSLFLSILDGFSSISSDLFLSNWAFLNGLGLFITGTVFCFSFSRMEVKSVVAVARIPDIILPVELVSKGV